jgi:hypothetical protein
MIKDYEFVGKQCAVLHLKYFGIDVKVEFTNGNTARQRGAEFSTNDRFVQDAIEHDSRFGSVIKLRGAFPEASDKKPEPTDKAAKEEKTKGGKSGKGGKASNSGNDDDGSSAQAVESCKNMNDIVKFFADKGEKPEGDEDIKALMEKYNVSFPNVKF